MTQASQQLPLGQAFQLRSSGAKGVVGQLIGAGGQGAVYACDVGGRRLALKWYHRFVVQQDAGLRRRIEQLVAVGPPDARYLWPLDSAIIEGRTEFGYIMPLMNEDRRPLKDLIAPPPRRLELPLESRALACFEIAESFAGLHAKGLSYQDLNFGAFAIDPVRGGVLICDADNVTTDGLLGGVLGTRKFMAPEVARQEAIPSVQTDLYSMAVLFFYIIFGWHPLDGRREAAIVTLDREADHRLYASDPLFIFDPVNRDNGPEPGLHDWLVARWASMTEEVRGLFTRSFTSGLANPRSGRVVETEWLRAFAHLRASVARCGRCSFEHALDGASENAPTPCAACGAHVATPPHLRLGAHFVRLEPGDELYPHQLAAGASFALAPPSGRVNSHPTDPNILGLQNMSAQQWIGQTPEGGALNVAPGKTVKLIDGMVVDFGGRRGVMRLGPFANGAAP